MSLTMKEFAFFPNADKPAVGLIFAVDEKGGHVTAVGDPETVRLLLATPNRGDMELPADLFPWQRPGWPDEWANPKQAAKSLRAVGDMLDEAQQLAEEAAAEEGGDVKEWKQHLFKAIVDEVKAAMRDRDL
jgi:hypothetical protein